MHLSLHGEKAEEVPFIRIIADWAWNRDPHSYKLLVKIHFKWVIPWYMIKDIYDGLLELRWYIRD